jgi:hypothetical protein
LTDRPRRLRDKRQTQEGDDAELAALIGGPLRVGTFQGVHIDLRHGDIPQGEWEALPWWHVWGPTPKWAGIIFPSEASVGLKKLRAGKAWRDLPAIYARPGDRITVAAVSVERARNSFDHPHDREVRLATLRIERATGETVEAGPLAFYGTGAIVGHATREAFDHMVERILGHAGFAGFSTPDERLDAGEYWGLSLEHAALKFAQSAHRDFFRLHDAMSADEAGNDRAVLRSLANDAMLAGFLLAKIEAQKPVGMATATMANRAKGTAKVTRTDWREKARAIWSEHPELRRERVANLIAEGTDDDPRSIKRAIKPLDPHAGT